MRLLALEYLVLDGGKGILMMWSRSARCPPSLTIDGSFHFFTSHQQLLLHGLPMTPISSDDNYSILVGFIAQIKGTDGMVVATFCTPNIRLHARRVVCLSIERLSLTISSVCLSVKYSAETGNYYLAGDHVRESIWRETNKQREE